MVTFKKYGLLYACIYFQSLARERDGLSTRMTVLYTVQYFHHYMSFGILCRKNKAQAIVHFCAAAPILIADEIVQGLEFHDNLRLAAVFLYKENKLSVLYCHL